MKPKTKTLAFVLMSFILGVAAGIAIDKSSLSIFRTKGSRMNATEFRDLFHRRIELQSHQVAIVDSLLDAYRMRMNVHRERILIVRDSLRTEIRKVLTDRQQQLYEEFNREMGSRDGRTDSTRTKRY